MFNDDLIEAAEDAAIYHEENQAALDRLHHWAKTGHVSCDCEDINTTRIK
jgi:hypothetical protein